MGQLWHGILQPHQPITDIAFFEYPAGYDGPGWPFEIKLALRDSDGSTFSIVNARTSFDRSATNDPIVQVDRLKVLAPFKDYSSIPIVHVDP